MSALDQVDVDQLADGDASLTVADVEALVTGTADGRIYYPASAWLEAYRLARWLGFTETTAQVQAGAAWDRAADELAAASSITLVEVN